MSWWESAYRSGHVNWDPGEYDAHLPRLLHDHAIAPCRALDPGCGNGKSAVWLATQGFEVVGIDLAPSAIEQARERADAHGVSSRCTLLTGRFLDRVADDSLAAGGFGLVTERAFLQHAGDGRTLEQTLRAIERLLEPHGIFYSVIIAGASVPRYWSMARLTERGVRRLFEPRFTIRELRRDVFTPGDRGSMPAWVTVMESRHE